MGAGLRAGPAGRAGAAGGGRVPRRGGPRGRRAGELLPGVDQVVVEHAAWIDAAPRRVSREAVDALVDRLTDLEIDQAVVLTSFHQSPLPLALVLRMAGVPAIAAVSVDYPGSLLDVRHRVDEDLHEVERGLSLVATLGYRLPEGDDGALRVRRDLAADAPDLGGGDYVVVHPGASVPARAWAPERHAALVDALVGRGRRVVVTGSAGERVLTAMVAGGRRAGWSTWGGGSAAAGPGCSAGDVVVVGTPGRAPGGAVGWRCVVFSRWCRGRWRPWGVPQVLLGDQAAVAGVAGRDARCPGIRAWTGSRWRGRGRGPRLAPLRTAPQGCG